MPHWRNLGAFSNVFYFHAQIGTAVLSGLATYDVEAATVPRHKLNFEVAHPEVKNHRMWAYWFRY